MTFRDKVEVLVCTGAAVVVVVLVYYGFTLIPFGGF